MTDKTPIIQRYPEERPLEEDIGLWWVLHTKPNCEKMVATYLLNRKISYYLPTVQRKERVGGLGRIRTTEIPLFRGYLCVALEKKEHNLLYDTKKFVRILEVDDQAQFVQELNGVARAVESFDDWTLRYGLVPGKRVLILSGPLAGFEGVLVRRKTDKQLALSVEMFNQSVLVKLDPFTRLEPL
ncbi:MAG: transcription termination/antitermination protein NusG [Thermodesulfobacteriota bacterium]